MVTTSPPAAGPGTAFPRATRLLPITVDLAVVGAVGVCALFDVAVGFDGLFPVKALASLGAMAMAMLRRWAALPAIAVLTAGSVALALAAQATFGLVDTVPPVAPAIAVAALSTTAVRRLPVPWAVTAGILGAVTVVVSSTWPVEPIAQLGLGVALGGAWALGVGAGVYLRHLDDAQVRAAEDARRAERLDIARDLHDLVAHYVTGIVVQAQAAQVISARDPDAAGAALERIEGAGRDALTAMRGMVGSLRAAADETAPTAPNVGLAGLDDLAGLEDLAARSRAAGLPVTLRISAEASGWAQGARALSVHRIVQESLTNVHRHAVDATAATVDVAIDGAALVVTVTDDGRPATGDPTLAGAGFGLVGMGERAQALGGTLVAGPVDPPGHGWRVRATFPLDAP
ncbi:MAG TPA: histidine kinase [Iamia sp.]|nr:histidine kinase [Iamia sp.]